MILVGVAQRRWEMIFAGDELLVTADPHDTATVRYCTARVAFERDSRLESSSSVNGLSSAELGFTRSGIRGQFDRSGSSGDLVSTCACMNCFNCFWIMPECGSSFAARDWNLIALGISPLAK